MRYVGKAERCVGLATESSILAASLNFNIRLISLEIFGISCHSNITRQHRLVAEFLVPDLAMYKVHLNLTSHRRKKP
jgi:hypothetical protein